ncbi:DUF1553 domain-containing protein [Roseiconus lacunae]|uniref:DUF1553 domain-containing protein n=1 Tax=Roseiconus lacunae TaxID=2605694 RepID=UPI0011F39EC0|nr:DUF1553 domain-containing protein [Roseiconus lacunae]
MPSTAATVLIALIMQLGNEPVVRWNFDAKDPQHPFAEKLQQKGNVYRDIAGPRPPEFPEMSPENTAAQVDANAYLSLPDPGTNSPFDFSNGDEITIEAWVNPTQAAEGQPLYVIGKGRTGRPGFGRDNQNWALRIVSRKGEAHLSFLFATPPSSGDRHWHRWTTTKSFPVGTGWHHVAVAYRFGAPDTVRGWINGQATDGRWDMGGATKESPIVDDDEIRVGSRFIGRLDDVAIHRQVLTDEIMLSRFRRIGKRRVIEPQPEVMPEIASVADNQVVVQVCELMPSDERWLNEGERWPDEAIRFESSSFLLPRLPLHYDEVGVRDAWKAPLLLRMIGDVDLQPGQQQFLIRARGQSRLWVDGKLVARTDASNRKPPDGEEPVAPLPKPPIAGTRPHRYGQQESIGQVMIEAAGEDSDEPIKRCRVVFEVIVGGNARRTETGEICVAVLSPDGNRYSILAPASERVPLTDAAVKPELRSIESALADFDDQRRRDAMNSVQAYWDHRHRSARQWVSEQSAQPVVPDGTHPVDYFIESKIQAAIETASGENAEQAAAFHEDVLPLLREQCFRCHGEKSQGGLKLDSRDAALAAGDSEVPAVVPGNSDASELIARVVSGDMPPTENGLSDRQIETMKRWIDQGAAWPAPPIAPEQVSLAPTLDDAAYLRRLSLDTIGVLPGSDEVRSFIEDSSPSKRTNLAEKLLRDDRFADHWISFWLDRLAENPSLLNASLNSTGPFRWFLYDSLRDNKAIDRMATELVMLRGGAAEGGSAGFGLAGENDSPMAAKGHIVASAFLGIELQCARCHDSPYHSTTQEDLYSLAAMFSRKPVKVPATSRVPDAFFDDQKGRQSLIEVTLPVGQAVEPTWPFADITGVSDGPDVDSLVRKSNDSRERLAVLLTAPQNHRFPKVIVNHVWKRLIGTGFVEPVHDWEGQQASHSELLEWLARDFVAHDYDFRHLVQRIVSSKLYQRKAVGENAEATPELRFFAAPDRRRMSAEQIVDCLHVATGQSINVEELTFVHDGRRSLGARQTLGIPRRAWMFGDLKNERDRPSLSLPRARAVADVLEAFGWTGSRQRPIHERDLEPNVLQPGVLANGTLSVSLTRAAHQSSLADLACEAASADELVETLFLRFLTRLPTEQEREVFGRALSDRFEQRQRPGDQVKSIETPPRLPQVDWFNHLRPRANEIQLEIEQRVQAGPPADPRLDPLWREVYEDVVWSLINHSEFVWMP